MRPSVAVLVLVSASLLLAGSAHASGVAHSLKGFVIASGGAIVIPPEWDGIWTVQDSAYDCQDVFNEYTVDEDTLCAGQVYYDPPEGVPFALTCKGTADATTAHVTCTGSDIAFPDCQVDVVTVLDAVRTGTTYRAVLTASLTYSGTGTGCDFMPDMCTRVVSYGTWHDPAPPAYCATPTQHATWGEIKLLYR